MSEPSFTSNAAIRANRQDPDNKPLSEGQLDRDPFLQFNHWLQEAIDSGLADANAMVLSTTGSDHMPDSRIVLLRDVSYGGFTFYTNYNSKKGQDIRTNPKACLLFFWPRLMRQVRVQGELSCLSGNASDTYFAERPFGHQVGAWSSQQSQVIGSREALEQCYEKNFTHFEGREVPRPPYWGGYVLRPSQFEFWQGRESRLHDRFRYRCNREQHWQIDRLMP